MKVELSNFNYIIVLYAQYKIISPTFEVRQATTSLWYSEEYSDNCLFGPVRISGISLHSSSVLFKKFSPP